MNKQEMEQEIARLKNHKGNLIQAKTSIQNKFAILKGNGHSRETADERVKLCTMFNDVEQKIQAVNEKLRNISVAKRELSVIPPEKSLIRELVALRDDYQQFAADKTRVSSLRVMATEFVIKLNPIIRKLVNEG